MSRLDFTELEQKRLYLIWLLMMTAILILAVQLWRIQVSKGEDYEISLDQQSIRHAQIPAPRGRILDRHGVVLADNSPNYCVALFLEELRRPGKRWVTIDDVGVAIDQLAKITGQRSPLTREQISTHLHHRKALPLVVYRRADVKMLACLAEAEVRLPGLEILVDIDRVYPQGSLAAHTLGYVGLARPGEEDQHEPSYWPVLVGRSGIEKAYDEQLRGRNGGKLVRVDVSGFKHAEIGFREPVPGADIVLSLDAAIQRSAEKALRGAVGAVVVLDPRNGDVLAMASSPDFNPNDFSPFISSEIWAKALGDKRKPLFNRAAQGRYAPGSVFKPVSALAALETGRIQADTQFNCSGHLVLGGRRFTCFGGVAHGPVNTVRALELSCNVFFYELALCCGLDPVYQQAHALGFGQKTGIELDNENAGLLPGREWKRMTGRGAWFDGDTCNLAIGQGNLLATPLQIAVMTAALANGGSVLKPRLILAVRRPDQEQAEEMPPCCLRVMSWRQENLTLVRQGMLKAMESPDGTGRQARIHGVKMAGKTGTAEVGRKSEGRQHGWMIVFAPCENPRYAVAFVLDDAVSGGVSVGPRIKQLMGDLFQESGGNGA